VTTIGSNELSDMFWRGEIAVLPSGLSLIRMLENARNEGRVTADVDLVFTLPPQLQAAFLKRKTPAEALNDFHREATAALKR